jgi:predicted DNA-binding protein
MTTTTLSFRVGRSTKSRLEKLAKSTSRNRAFLAAETISTYLHTVDYVATDGVGLNANSTRIVLIEAASTATSTVQ